MRQAHKSSRVLVAASAVAAGLLSASWLAPAAVRAVGAAAGNPRFYDDDPLLKAADTQDASKAKPREISLIYDASINLFGRPGLRTVGRAESINTIDEVPDSSWFTNRAGTRPLTVDDMMRGPDDDTGPAPGQWTVSRKANGVSPGFTITDERGRRYFVKFDPPGFPELGTGAEAVVTRLLHAVGYYVPQVVIGTLRPADLVVGPGATVRLPDGSRRAMRRSDIDGQLRRAERNPDGTYRVILSAALPGQPLEGFKYEGTRADDPNDVVPHENRRELRGLRVFSAWLNHTDAKAINSMDMLQTATGRSTVRHYLLDFNATLGSAGIGERERRDGYEYLAEFGPALKALPAFGFNPRRWMLVEYPTLRGIGRFEAKAFVPEEWRPRVPNPAYVRSRPDDTFWGARKLMALSDDLIRAAVKAGRYTDPAAEKFLGDALIARRDLIGRAWLTAVNPIVDPALAADGTLTFRNAAVEYGSAPAPSGYHVVWHRFNNTSGDLAPLGESNVTAATGPADAVIRFEPNRSLPGDRGVFIRADISAQGGAHPSWAAPVHAFFRRGADGWKLVGFDRMPGAPVMRPGLVGAEKLPPR
ncbi:MAG: hypothetical protein ABJC89_20985 [Acidobacteriota bacterium]